MKLSISSDRIPAIRQWRGAPLSPVEEVLMYHDDAGPVPETYRRLRAHLLAQGIDHVVIGALALAAHHFRRATEDVDVCVRPEGLALLREKLVGSVYQSVEGRPRRFYDPLSQVTIDVLISGHLAGRVARNKQIRFPDPAESVTVDGLPTVSLGRLIELKLVTWRQKDWVDVIELIRRNELGEEFAQEVHPQVRMAYLQCYDQKEEEDRSGPEA